MALFGCWVSAVAAGWPQVSATVTCEGDSSCQFAQGFSFRRDKKLEITVFRCNTCIAYLDHEVTLEAKSR